MNYRLIFLFLFFILQTISISASPCQSNFDENRLNQIIGAFKFMKGDSLVERFRYLIQKDTHVDSTDSMSSVLTEDFFIQIIETLIKEGADPNKKDAYGYPLLALAINGYSSIIHTPSISGVHGQYKIAYQEPILFTVLKKYIFLLKESVLHAQLLIPTKVRNFHEKQVAKQKEEDKQKKLMNAIFFKFIEILLKNGANPNTVDKDGTPVLVLAFKRKIPIKVIKTFIDNGANPNTLDPQFSTPVLSIAVQRKDMNLIQLLLKKGADPNKADELGYTPFVQVIKGNYNPQLLELFIKHDAILNSVNKNVMLTPLMAVLGIDSRVTRKKVIQYLILAGADVDQRNKHGVTALMLASEYHNVSTVQLLLELGADPNITDQYGNTALFYAIKYDNKDAIVDPENSIKIMKSMIKHGVNPNIQNDNDMSFLRIIRKLNDEQILKAFSQNHHTLKVI